MAEKFSSGYKKDLSLFNLIMLNAMGMIGSGWLLASMKSATYAGPIGAILSWIIASVIVILMALTFMEVSTAFPLAGGSTPIAELSHGKMAGFLAGWGAWLSDVMTPPIEAIAMVTYLSFFIKGLVNAAGTLEPLGYLVALITLVVILVINLQAVKIFGNITSAIMVWKWAIPALTAITLITLVLHPSNFTAYGSFYNGYTGIFSALVLGGIVFSFEGYRAAINMAAEAKHKDYIWKSVIYAILLVTVLYIALQIAFIGALNWSYIGISPGNWGGLLTAPNISNAPFAKEAAAVGFGWLVVILMIDAVISPTGAGISYAAYPARIFQSMAEYGYAPKFFAELHKTKKIPARAMILGFFVGLAFLYEFPSWSLLVGILTSTLVIAYVMGPASVNVLRKTAPRVERLFMLKGAKIIAPIAFILTFFIVYWSTWPLTGQVVGVVLAGLIIFAYYYHKNKFPIDDIKSGIWFVLLLIIVAVLSYIGPTNYGGINIIPFPYDFIFVGIVGLVFYYWAQVSGRKTKSLEEYLKQTNQE
ncbi:MAG: APC family permease [Thermoplasmata archaeon]